MRLNSLRTVLALSIVTCGLVLVEITGDTWATTATMSFASGCTALVLMGAACVLGSRWRIVELAFGGLDRVYETHKWLGVWALALASYHLVFKANLEQWDSIPIWELSKYSTRLVRQLEAQAQPPGYRGSAGSPCPPVRSRMGIADYPYQTPPASDINAERACPKPYHPSTLDSPTDTPVPLPTRQPSASDPGLSFR